MQLNNGENKMSNLSDEIIITPGDVDEGRLQVEAVKSFIEQLKSELTNSHNMKPEHVQMLIDQLAGSKLI